MRVLLLFLALFVPAFALLAVAGEKNLRRDLPSIEPTMKRTPLIDAKELTGTDGEPPPLRGIVWKLDETLFRTVESGYVKVAVELGELARDKRGPHFKRLRARYYNQPPRESSWHRRRHSCLGGGRASYRSSLHSSSRGRYGPGAR